MILSRVFLTEGDVFSFGPLPPHWRWDGLDVHGSHPSGQLDVDWWLSVFFAPRRISTLASLAAIDNDSSFSSFGKVSASNIAIATHINTSMILNKAGLPGLGFSDFGDPLGSLGKWRDRCLYLVVHLSNNDGGTRVLVSAKICPEEYYS